MTLDPKAFIESKFFLDAAVDDTIAFLDRASTDYRSHSTLAEVLYKVSISIHRLFHYLTPTSSVLSTRVKWPM